MTDEGFKRKLTAILSADVEGYSRLMGEDEDATIRTLTTYRGLMSAIIQKHRGRVVDSPGDNLLAEFNSVVDAVRCAVEIQEELRVRNAELPETRKMEFRIGINLGDVVEEGERIYGDGVNITARVEGLAEGGGICISGTVYDSIKNKLSLSYESLGEHTVKNIKEPVRVYRMRIGPDAAALGVSKDKRHGVKRWQWIALAAMVVLIVGAVAIWNFYFRLPSVEPASVEKMAYPLPDKPSIAVLPFDNLSGDPEQEYIADGITENIITTLSYISELFVIARNSTYTYKGKPVKAQQVSEDLGVRYVLEGGVQKSGDRVRVTAQLIDALSGHHLFAKRYDRDLKDFFSLQDEITQKIIVELQVKLTAGEESRMFLPQHNLEAWEYAIKGNAFSAKFTKEDNVKARELLEQAVKIEPGYAAALATLAHIHYNDARFRWSESRAKSFKQATDLAKKVLSLDKDYPGAHSLMSDIYLAQRQYDKAITSAKKAVNLSPNNSLFNLFLAGKLTYAGKYQEAIAPAEKGMRLSPYPPAVYYMMLGRAYRDAGRYEQALTAYKQLLSRSKKGEITPYYAHLWLSVIYIYLGREAEAQAHAEEFLKLEPNPSLDYMRKVLPYKDPSRTEQVVEAIRKAWILAGWKESES
jgi:adenylate cyclase